MLLLDGVEVHVREDAFKSCLRRHLDWLDELVIDADDNTWFRWMSRRRTKDQRRGQMNQMSGDGGVMYIGTNQSKTGQKRRFEVQSRTRTVAQNVLKAVKRRRGSAAAQGTLPQQRVQSQTMTAVGQQPIGLLPAQQRMTLNRGGRGRGRGRGLPPCHVSPAMNIPPMNMGNQPGVHQISPANSVRHLDSQFQQQRTPPRSSTQTTPVKPAPPCGESPRISLQSGIDLKPSVTDVSQQQLNESENVVSSMATAPVSSASAETVNFSVLDASGCEILLNSEIESTLESIKNAEEESDDSMIPDDSNVDASSAYKNETNVEQPSESGLSTPPPPAVSSCDNALEQLESIVSSAPSFGQLEISSSAIGGENIELKYSDQLTDTNTADINTLPVQQSHHHQGYEENVRVKNEPIKIEPVEISSGSDDDEDYSTQQIIQQQQHDPQPGTSGAFDQSGFVIGPVWHLGMDAYSQIGIEQNLSAMAMATAVSLETFGEQDKHRKQCSFCGKQFMKVGDLNRHRRIHTGEKPFKCPMCERCFTLKAQCNMHMKRVHINEKPFKCQFCDEGFDSPADLTQHERIHTGEKPFKCPMCDLRFMQISTRNRHMKSVHTDAKPFKCPFCEEGFASPADCKQHEHVHTGEKPFKCPICGQRFNRKYHCQKHMKRVHDVFDSSFDVQKDH